MCFDATGEFHLLTGAMLIQKDLLQHVNIIPCYLVRLWFWCQPVS